MASNFWGIPRTTHDLDFVIQLPPSAISTIVDAFSGDFFLDEAAVRAAYNAPYQFNAIDKRSTFKVDFWLPRPTTFERETFARRRRETIFSEPVWIATAEDVLLHKLYRNQITPSDRQLGDAAGIAVVQKGILDLAYLRNWATEIGVVSTLEDVLAGRIKPKQT